MSEVLFASTLFKLGLWLSTAVHTRLAGPQVLGNSPVSVTHLIIVGLGFHMHMVMSSLYIGPGDLIQVR